MIRSASLRGAFFMPRGRRGAPSVRSVIWEKRREPVLPWGYLIPEDLYIQVGVR